MNKLTFIFLIFCSILQAQQGSWQNFPYWERPVTEVLETGNDMWFSSEYALVKLEKASQKSIYFSIEDLGFNIEILDIAVGNNDQLFVLGSQNQIIEWKEGEWHSWRTFDSSSGTNILKIHGQTKDGSLLLEITGWKTIRLTKENGYSLFENGSSVEKGSRFNIKIIENDQMWIWSNYEIVLIDENQSVSTSLELPYNLIYDFKLDEDEDAWVWVDRKVFHWSKATNDWVSIDLEDLSFGERALIYPYTNQQALLMTQQRAFILSFDEGNLFKEELIGQFTEENLPPRIGGMDENNRFWYLDRETFNLMYWEKDHTPKAVFNRAWIPNRSAHGMTIDKQGVVWVGFLYFSGGQWNEFETKDIGLSRIDDIAFTSDNELVISAPAEISSTLSTVVFKWNKDIWDRIGEGNDNDFFPATTSSLFYPDMPRINLEIDKQENIWHLRPFDTSFFIFNEGRWLEYMTGSTFLNVNRNIAHFTCLAEAPDDKMWIGTDNGVLIYDGLTFDFIDKSEFLLPENTDGNSRINDIAFDDKGHAWISLKSGGISKWDGKEWQQVWTDDSVSDYIHVTGIVQGNEDEMWAMTERAGVIHFDGDEWEMLDPTNSGLKKYTVHEILKDYRGRIWFAQKNNVSVLHPTENKITPFSLNATQNLAIYPNPGCCLYRVHWHQAEAASSSLKLINAKGQILRKWSFEDRSVGDYEMEIGQDNLPSGTYFIQLSIGGENVESIPLIVTNF